MLSAAFLVHLGHRLMVSGVPASVRCLPAGKFFMLFCRLPIFAKIISGLPSECHTDLNQIGPDLGPNFLQRLSADDARRQRAEQHILLNR